MHTVHSNNIVNSTLLLMGKGEIEVLKYKFRGLKILYSQVCVASRKYTFKRYRHMYPTENSARMVFMLIKAR
ncbi:hypothetical protein D1627_10365 [Pontibacter oryzae]|uniref:Uncharacterized protein n=1 Tax=Pontibacter oryzae TaxID=2304593 RepID=A0A399S620_9BACT|nr:hypothetical protein D1627_10365 [Pontibacter oryzae]